MKWFILWFAIGAQEPATWFPPKNFDTERECLEYGDSRVRMVETFYGPMRFECKAFPFVVPKA